MASALPKVKASEAYRTISEVAEELDLPQHVLRFWETRFTQIKPMKRGGGRRYYRPEDVDLIKGIRTFLYGEGYTIRGLQKIIKDNGQAYVMAVGRGEQSIDSIEKPKGPEIVPVENITQRTRARFEEEDDSYGRLKQPVFARHLIETLSERIDARHVQDNHPQNNYPLKEEAKMDHVKPVLPNYSLRTSYSSQPLNIPPLTSAVSHGRGLTKPMTKDPSPLVKFRPIEEVPDELPAFVKERKFALTSEDRFKVKPVETPVIETRAETRVETRVEPIFNVTHPRETRQFEARNSPISSQNIQNRLQSALYELTECKRLLNAAF